MYYSAQHKACVYETPVPERILACIPGAKAIDHNHVVVPHNLLVMQAMRFLGYPALSPIMTEYDWPRDQTKIPFPFKHQYHISSFLTLHRRAFNLSDMGTGKTLSTLWAAEYLMSIGMAHKCLILAPLSTLTSVWEDAITRHLLAKRSCNVLYGDRDKRLGLLNQERDFYIINHDGLGVGSARGKSGISLGKLAQTIAEREDIDLIICDEGSCYKDASTLRYKILKKTTSHKPYIWWLTGSPAANDPTDAHAQARMVRKNYDESKKSFQERTMLKVSTFKWVPRKDAASRVAEILQPSIRYDIDDCIDLPPMVIQSRDVPLTAGQKKALDELKKTLKVSIGEGQITALNEAGLRQKLIQIACGAVYGPDHEVHLVDCAPRLDILREIIEESKDKLIVFAPLTSVINLLYLELGKSYSVAKIAGDVSKAKRDEIFRDFQTGGNPRIIVAHPGTMAHGIDLTAATKIVWYGPEDNAEIYEQANRRIKRPGQTKSMSIVRLTATNLEKEIYRRLDTKERMQGAILSIIRGDD